MSNTSTEIYGENPINESKDNDDFVYFYDLDDPHNVITLAKVIRDIRYFIKENYNNEKTMVLYFVKAMPLQVYIDFFELNNYLISSDVIDRLEIVFRGDVSEHIRKSFSDKIKVTIL